MKDNVKEYNSIPPDELNTTNIDELNLYANDSIAVKRKSGLITRKLISSFLVACAVTAMAQSTFTIPIFSRIFHPTSAEQSNEEIIEKPYIANVQINKDYVSDIDNKSFHIQAILDESFTNYELIFYELVDADGNILVDEYGNQINFTTIPKANITTFWARFDIKKTEPEKDYGLNIYCSTNDASKLKYTKTKTKDSVKYYLIYQHPTKIRI